MQRPGKPSHAAVTRYIASILPVKENDIPRHFHVPNNVRYDPERAGVDQIVLSVTPTPGVYSFIGKHEPFTPRPPRTLCFLHRPWTLDRRNVQKGTLILSSHSCFDELLTVGWNIPLAERLGMDVDKSLCVQGYREDSQRKLGIVGGVSLLRGVLLERIEHEFGKYFLAHEGLSDDIRAVAIMNAFTENQVEAVIQMAIEAGLVEDDGEAPGKHMLYLTGQPRVSGMEAARESGVTVVCVGHGRCEDWGIRYLSAQLRAAFPDVKIKEVYEEEPAAKPRRRDADNADLPDELFVEPAHRNG